MLVVAASAYQPPPSELKLKPHENPLHASVNLVVSSPFLLFFPLLSVLSPSPLSMRDGPGASVALGPPGGEREREGEREGEEGKGSFVVARI
jgi:hypothetical protein